MVSRLTSPQMPELPRTVCDDSDTCATIQSNHLEPVFSSHTCANTPISDANIPTYAMTAMITFFHHSPHTWIHTYRYTFPLKRAPSFRTHPYLPPPVVGKSTRTFDTGTKHQTLRKTGRCKSHRSDQGIHKNDFHLETASRSRNSYKSTFGTLDRLYTCFDANRSKYLVGGTKLVPTLHTYTHTYIPNFVLSATLNHVPVCRAHVS